jgi:hypothetical protein
MGGAGIADVEGALVRRESEAVGLGEIVRGDLQVAGRRIEPVDMAAADLARARFGACKRAKTYTLRNRCPTIFGKGVN